MRDPMNWALRVFTAFGIPVRIHLFFFIFTLGMFLRQVAEKGSPYHALDVFLFTVLMLFGIILLHEFGHCFAARSVGGDAREILIWPLGGLAMVEAPHAPRPHFIVAAGGPLVNVILCVASTAALAVAGFLPNLNPISNPYRAQIYNFKDGRSYTSEYGLKTYKPGTSEAVPTPYEDIEKQLREEGALRESDYLTFTPEANAKALERMAARGAVERAVAPLWAVWLQRLFWMSWVLLLFNLLPAFPLDGGQMLQAIVWGRTGDFRRGTTVACYSGFVVSVIFLIVSIWKNEAQLLGLALFMLYMASMKLMQLDQDEGPFGYDFSAGYTSLEKDDPPPKPKRPGPVARWLQARKAKKMKLEAEQKARDSERMELLLEKINASGMASLTGEEKRFLEQFSSRYRKH